MPDNLLKATVEAIAESDNEIGGHLVTRLRESHVYGRDDGTVAAADADRLVSPVDVFTAEMEGQGIDVLDAPATTGNQGSYIIDNYVDAQNVDLVKIGDGAAAAFVDESNVRWRFTTLRVETTWQFPDHDKNQRLWVGDEPAQIPYCELVQTPLVQEFRGIGEHVVAIDGIVSASGSTIETVGEFFTASMAGAAVWVFPKATSTGNEGPRRITVVTDSRTVTVSSPAFAADETEVMFAVKTYPRLGAGYLTKRGDIDYHRELAEVFEASGGYSSLDQLRRAILVDYATEEELDRIGSNLGVYRSWIMDDEMYRRYIMARAYLPATTVEAFEIILEALFPAGGWSIYEDQMTHPNEVYILDLPGYAPGTDIEGRTFLAPSGNEGGPPPAVIDPAGKGGREVQTSTSTTTVDVEHPIISVVDVLLADYEQLLDMGVLPSADSPSWSYNGEGPAPPSEVSVFSVVSVGGEDVLEHGIFSGPSRNGGNYSQANTGEIDGKIGSRCLISAWWRGLSLTLVNDRPWCIGLQNTGIGKNVYLRWSETDIAMTNASGSIPSGAPAAVTPTADIDDGGWHRFELEIVVDPRGYFAIAKLDGQDLFGRVNLYPFSTATADEFMFGYEDTGNNQNWTVQWDRVQVWARSARNFYNYTQFEGDFVGGGASFDDITNSPFVAGDVGKLIRTRGYERLGDTFENRHDGLWKIDSLTSASRVVLEPVTHGPAGDRLTQGVTVTGSNTTINDTPDRPGTFNGALITIPEGDVGMFRVEDGPSVLHDSTGGYDATSNSADAKSILISGSGQGNDGSYKILEVISDRVVRVNNAGGFTTEAGLTWGFDVTDFQATAGLCEYEIVDRGSHAEPTITLGQSLPGGTEEVHCWYTSVLSGQVLRNEFVSNDGSEGTEPDIWYPFYIRDVDREIQRIIEDVSAAGVIPRFKREF